MRVPGFNKQRNAKPEENDLGFGTRITARDERLMSPDGEYNIKRTGVWSWSPYQNLVQMSWPRFFLLVFVYYTGINLLFACLFYILGPEQFTGMKQADGMLAFADYFFFSAQTLTTVGYGYLSPTGIAASIVASLEALVGLLTIALATGLLFARFSRPQARFIYSENMLIAPFKDGKALMFRLANLRNNNLMNVEARLTISWIETSPNGESKRRFAPLELERDRITLFPMSWTIVHPITDTSPLHNKNLDEIMALKPEVIILVSGFDEIFSQTVHSKRSYTWENFICNARFLPMFEEKNGQMILQLDKIGDYQLVNG